MTTLNQETFITDLAQALGETQRGPIGLLRRIVDHYGIDQAQTWLRATERIQAAGGELRSDGQRRRTFAVFCHLARKGALSQNDALLPGDTRLDPPRQAQRSKQGRKSWIEDDWAWEQVNLYGQSPKSVQTEWKRRSAHRGLRDSSGSFRYAIKLDRKK